MPQERRKRRNECTSKSLYYIEPCPWGHNIFFIKGANLLRHFSRNFGNWKSECRTKREIQKLCIPNVYILIKLRNLWCNRISVLVSLVGKSWVVRSGADMSNLEQVACDDLKAFERRLTEIIASSHPSAYRWYVMYIPIIYTGCLFEFWMRNLQKDSNNFRTLSRNFSLKLPTKNDETKTHLLLLGQPRKLEK